MNISRFMLPFEKRGARGPLVVALHWLSGSAKTWTEVSEGLAARGATVVALDLPGFGKAAGSEDTSIAASVDEVIATVRQLRREHGGPWVLMGHSMGGKMSAIVARAAADGEAGLEDLRAVVLVSPSPPGVEPMKESTRGEMMESLGESSRDGEEDQARAKKFVEDNVGKLELKDDVMERTVRDVTRMSRAAFRLWLTTSSKEDWGEKVGVLAVPALVMAGSEEPALAPKTQQKVTLPHFAHVELVTLEGSGHLGVLERPAEVVDRTVEFLQKQGLEIRPDEVELDEGFRALIESERTTPQTRAVMLARMHVEGDEGGAFDEREGATLRAMVGRVLPGAGIDLMPRIEQWMSAHVHDGWRHDELPPDAAAWRKGLQSMEAAAMREFGVPFVALDAGRQDAMLGAAQQGELGGGVLSHLGLGDAFTAEEMKLWFGDFCAEVTKLYVSDPRTMQRMGFTGFADEGGFTQIRLGEREGFER